MIAINALHRLSLYFLFYVDSKTQYRHMQGEA